MDTLTKKGEQRRKLLRLAKENPEPLEAVEDIKPLIQTLGGDADVMKIAHDLVETRGEIPSSSGGAAPG